MRFFGIIFVAISLLGVDLHAADTDSQTRDKLKLALALVDQTLPKGWKRTRTELNAMPPGSINGAPTGIFAVFQGTRQVVIGKISTDGQKPRDNVGIERVSVWIMPLAFKGRRVNAVDRLIRFPGLIETQPDRIGSNNSVKVYGRGAAADLLSQTSWPTWREDILRALRLRP